MNGALLRKNLRDSRWLLAAGSAALFAFAWIRVVIVANMQTEQFSRIARALPEMVKKLSPIPIEQLISYTGLIGFTFEEPVTYLIMAVWAISRGSDVVSGQLAQGTLELLLAQPVSRLRYLLSHWAITALGIVVLSFAAYAGTWTGIERTSVRVEQRRPWATRFFGGIGGAGTAAPPEVKYIPMRQYVAPQAYLPAAANYAALGFFLAGLSSAVSSVDRYRWRTIGIVVAFYVLQSVMELTAMAIDGWRWLLKFTFFSAYEPVAILTDVDAGRVSAWDLLAPDSQGMLPDLGPAGYDLVLLGLGFIGFCLAMRVFARRDLPAPV